MEEFLQQHAQDTDVFCFQEADGPTEQVCKAILREYRMLEGCKRLSAADDLHQMTFVRQSIAVSASALVLRDTPDTGLALYTCLQTETGVVHVYNVHGVSRPGDKLDSAGRLMQSRKLLESCSTCKGLKVVGGDFNLDPSTQSVHLFTQAGYRNLLAEYHIATTRNRFVWERYPETKQLFSDYVFVNEELRVTEFKVPNVEVSDHLPMLLTFEC
jgi:endonuclease/exonuclease/phosphatase family metal-dependent hydrolase